MKTVALLLLASTLMLSGCSTMQTATGASSRKAAIQSVFEQRANLKSEEGGMGHFSKENLSRLMAIDVSKCPADFRSAWFDYLVQKQNLHTRAVRVAIFANASGKKVTDLPSLIKFAVANRGLGEYLLDAVNQTDNAWNKLDRTAMQYGVMPER